MNSKEKVKKEGGINPLKQNQFELLENIGCDDLARKVNEIVANLNNHNKRIEKIGERLCIVKRQIAEEPTPESSGKCKHKYKETTMLSPCGSFVNVCEKCGWMNWKKDNPQKTDWEKLPKDICKNCRGKGYSTEMMGESYAMADFPGDKTYKIDSGGIKIHYCKCERGKQIEKLLSQKEQETREEIGAKYFDDPTYFNERDANDF